MYEIFRMQLGLMLNGRRKWLVLLSLSLPVLLTLAMVSAGAMDEVRAELEADGAMHAYSRGVLPSTCERVRWEGDDVTIGRGRWAVTLTRDGLYYRGDLVGTEMVFVFDYGRYVVLDGELWMDSAKPEGRGRNLRVQGRRNSDPDLEIVPDDEPELSFEIFSGIYLFLMYPQAICLLLALFYGTSVLGSELDGKTLTYLFVRPLPRWKFVVGKFLGIVTALAVPAGLSLLASWISLGAEGLDVFGSVLLATIGALAAYTAVFTFIDFLIPRRAMIVALLYGLIFSALSFIPALVNQVTITYHLRSLVVKILDVRIPDEGARVVGIASIPVSICALTAIIGISLGLASLLATRREYLVKDRV